MQCVEAAGNSEMALVAERWNVKNCLGCGTGCCDLRKGPVAIHQGRRLRLVADGCLSGLLERGECVTFAKDSKVG